MLKVQKYQTNDLIRLSVEENELKISQSNPLDVRLPYLNEIIRIIKAFRTFKMIR